MNHQAEYLEEELRKARAENAELRKRVCVPEEYVVVAVEPTPGHIDSIAMRYRHDFGLLPEDQRDNLRRFARQMYEECTGQGFYKLPAAPAPVERVEQEAVAWRVSHPLDGWKTYAIYPDWAEGDDGFQIQPLYTTPQPAPTAAQDGWVSVAERMPPAGTKVLAFYRNSMGVSRRICAEYIGKHWRDAFDFDQDCEADYDEATDQYYWPEGWYERVDNWDELTHLAVTEGEITHWRVMPAVPGLDAHQSGGVK